LAGRQGFEPR